MQKDEEESGEESEEGSEEEVDEVLFFMAPNHDKIRSREDIEAQDYWEAGITAEATKRQLSVTLGHLHASKDWT